MSIIQVNTIRSKSGGSAPTCDQGLVVSGIATLGTVKVSTGIVTATTGIVTYYGDAQYLTNAGVAVTYIPNNVRIVGITTIDSQAHIGTGVTINSQGTEIIGIVTAGSYQGDGSTLSGIVTTIIAGTNISLVSTGGTGKGSVTISAFDDKGLFTSTPTGISTSENVGIGTTNAVAELTVEGNAHISGIVTATTFVGALTGTATASAAVNLVASNAENTTQYLTFVENATGSEEVRTDSTLSYIPSSDILNVGKVNVTGVTTSGSLEVGTAGTALNAGIGSVAIGRDETSYILEVGPTGQTDITQYVHGGIQATQNMVAGGSLTVTGDITSSSGSFTGNGDGLVGVGSTVQTKQIYWKTNTNTGLSTDGADATDWAGGYAWNAGQSVYEFEVGKYGPVNWVLVQCIGGGGSGGSNTYSGGGGSGMAVQRLFRAIDLPTKCTFDVGVGGAAVSGSVGADGADTVFSLADGSEVRAKGGKGGGTGNNSAGGAGGENYLNSHLADGTHSADRRGGLFSAAGGSATNNALRVGGTSVYGPGGGGGYWSNSYGSLGGGSLNPGSITIAGIGITTLVGGMGTGGYGANNGADGFQGGSPGGGGGGAASGNNSGAGGGGAIRIWMW
jgi:hypothetical protein